MRVWILGAAQSCSLLLKSRVFIGGDGTFFKRWRYLLTAESQARARQIRGVPGLMNCSVTQQSGYPSRAGSSAPAAGGSKSCDRFWRY
jgi:hypothetical protein